MTQLISREKQFIRINEHLNKMATSTLQNHSEYHYRTGAYQVAGTTTNITKAKPTNLAMRKRGGGDGGPEALVMKPPAKVSEIQRQRKMRQMKIPSPPTPTTPTPRIDANITHRAIMLPTKESPRKETPRKEVPSTTSSVVNSMRKLRKGVETARTSTISRISTNKPINTNTFTIKYRNPKFVESPSLEVLVKDESASIRELALIANTDPSKLSLINSNKQLTSDGLIKFLQSKIAILEDNHERISKEMAEQKELLEKTLDHHKKVEIQRDQAYAKNSDLKEKLSKMESQLQEANRHAKDRIMATSNQSKEFEAAKREIKVLTQSNANLEKRLQQSNEEVEATKNALKVLKLAERELKENVRRDFEFKDRQIKNLKKQRSDLINAYKKQLFLIDNLKRQNLCLEQSKLINLREKEFSKVLDWNTKA